jgi:hypothetical protein
MAADDELFNLKNLYNLGCYQLAITDAMQAISSPRVVGGSGLGALVRGGSLDPRGAGAAH